MIHYFKFITVLKKQGKHQKPHLAATKFSMKTFEKYLFSNIKNRKLRIWSHLLKKSLMENFIFCEVPF